MVNLEKTGEVAEWIQKELDKTYGGLVKSLSRLGLRKTLVIIYEFTGEGGGVGQGGRGGPGGGLGLGAMLGFEIKWLLCVCSGVRRCSMVNASSPGRQRTR